MYSMFLGNMLSCIWGKQEYDFSLIFKKYMKKTALLFEKAGFAYLSERGKRYLFPKHVCLGRASGFLLELALPVHFTCPAGKKLAGDTLVQGVHLFHILGHALGLVLVEKTDLHGFPGPCLEGVQIVRGKGNVLDKARVKILVVFDNDLAVLEFLQESCPVDKTHARAFAGTEGVVLFVQNHEVFKERALAHVLAHGADDREGRVLACEPFPVVFAIAHCRCHKAFVVAVEGKPDPGGTGFALIAPGTHGAPAPGKQGHVGSKVKGKGRPCA